MLKHCVKLLGNLRNSIWNKGCGGFENQNLQKKLKEFKNSKTCKIGDGPILALEN